MDDSGLRLRSVRMKPGYAIDSLTNALTGLGTQFDARVQSLYTATSLSQQQIAAAYRGSGLMRKIIGIPAMDMVREGWDWKADDDQAELIEAEEKRLLIRQKVRQVEVLRGLGGGALILGLPGKPREPAPTTVAKGRLAFINVVSRWQLQFDQTQDDSRLDGYGEPLMYRMETTVGQIDIHPSRVIPFRAEPVPPISGVANFIEDFWGDSRVAAVLDAVQDSDTARGAFANLITRARNVRIGIPNLLAAVSTTDGEAAFQRRMRAFAIAETIFNATVYDAGDGQNGGGEKIDDVSYKFEGIKDVMNAFGEWASAISDIPATRLLGRAPEGMNSSGDSQQKDWNKRVRAMQTLDLAPCLDRLFMYLIPSALGSRPPGVWYDFAPLDTPSETENATRFKTTMEAVEKLQATNAIPDEAFAKGVQSLMVDEGWLPGLEAALDEIPEEERYGAQGSEGDPAELEPVMQPRLAVANDATPRPLYVQRKLLNAADLIKWAKAQGFETTLPVDDMHVTVLYSRTPVDPMKMGETWASEENGGLVIKPGGPRAIERLGESAVVLLFASWSLESRHREMVAAGASHDFPEYMPHVTITLEAPADLDLEAIKPFTGELRFGPELFEPLDLDWKDKVEEA
jgi:phage-related protein (TIGR01555 family)